MKVATRFWLSVVLVVVLVPFLIAQQRTASSAAATMSAVSQSDAPDSCAHLFTSGASTSNTFIQYCVTDSRGDHVDSDPAWTLPHRPRRRGIPALSGESGSRISRLCSYLE